MKQTLAIGLGVSLLVLAGPTWAGIFGFAPWSYSAEPIEGRVVDRETGEPIEGAVIVAQWILEKPLEGHLAEHWVVIETVTDSQGRYKIPGWGPKWRPRFRWLDYHDPQLVVFKPGYWPLTMANENPTTTSFSDGINPHGSKVRKSYWNRRDIQLLPFRIGEEVTRKQLVYPESGDLVFQLSPEDASKRILMTEEKWADQISSVQLSVDWGSILFSWTAEEWLKIRNLVRMVHQECLRLPKNLRWKIDRLPEDYMELLLGEDALPCP